MIPVHQSSPTPPHPAPLADTVFGTWRWSPAGDRVTLDEPLRESLGFPAAAVPFADWLDRVAPDERDALVASWQAALDHGHVADLRFTLRTPHGARRFLARARIEQAAPGQRPTLAGVLIDITADTRRRDDARDRSRDQDDRLRLVQEVGQVGVFDWWIPEDRVEWSPELERLYGVPAGTFGDGIAAWTEHVHPDDAATVLSQLRACLARHGETCDFEFRARYPSGADRWLAGRVRVVYGADGTPLRMIGAHTDIDARQQTGHALRESETWFRHLADALPIMVWAARPDGTLDYVNAPWRRYTGHTSAEEWSRAVHPDDVAALRERWAAALLRRDRYEARCRLRRAADGAYRWHSVRAVPITDPSGMLIRWLGAFVDEHESRMLVEANQQLRASEQRSRQAAEDAARMKDEFLATLGHELRTPLNAIAGWTGLLKRGGLSAEDAARAVEVIEHNAQAQRHRIDELLDVSRIISGHVRLDLQPVYLEDVVERAVETSRPVAEVKGLRLDTRIEPIAEPIDGDPARLQQVFDHLLANAVAFTPPGGQVTVELERTGHEASVRVRDTGVGIDATFLPFVFDRFRQSESPGARRLGGLGLGLSIVKQIVQMHGGRVEATSAGEGAGAEFVVTLGLEGAGSGWQAPDVTASRAADSTTSPLRGLSMLIIEDDPDSREMLSVLLENAGAVPVAAATVTEGLRLLGDLQIDVVLSDIGMPERDGFDLIRALRSFPNPRVRRAPALAVTAFARDEDRERILAAGFDAHVSKPVEPAELFRAVTDVARRRAAEAAAGEPDDAGAR